MHTTMSDGVATVSKPCFFVAAGRINGIELRNRLLAAAIGIQLVIVTLKFRLEVFIANPRFEDFDVSAGVCGGSSLPGTG